MSRRLNAQISLFFLSTNLFNSSIFVTELYEKHSLSNSYFQLIKFCYCQTILLCNNVGFNNINDCCLTIIHYQWMNFGFLVFLRVVVVVVAPFNLRLSHSSDGTQTQILYFFFFLFSNQFPARKKIEFFVPCT